jgi:hypothetical protein
MPAAFTLSGTLKVVPKWVDSRGATDITDTAIATHTVALTNGVGTGAANAYWKDGVSVPFGSPVTIDVRSLTHQAFGGVGTLSLSNVKLVWIVNASATATVSIGVSQANGWSGCFTAGCVVPPNGVLYATSPTGWSTSASSRLIQLTNSTSGTATVNVVLVGVKA